MDLWNKIRNEGGYWEYFYEVDDETIASVIPHWGANGMTKMMAMMSEDVLGQRRMKESAMERLTVLRKADLNAL